MRLFTVKPYVGLGKLTALRPTASGVFLQKLMTTTENSLLYTDHSKQVAQVAFDGERRRSDGDLISSPTRASSPVTAPRAANAAALESIPKRPSAGATPRPRISVLL
ncbi:hypothetical protein VTN00DRAFT_5025 [Thermoascus crustaceus]|uniref:uncharacterized protein n=1 Tax=Thermoascus crustaceus TaxID=5088 RepID=UPI003744583C